MLASKVQTKYKNLGLPKYLQIKHIIKSKIEKRILVAGNRLPTLREMAVQFGVSYITMRQAILELEGDGLVKSIQGKGVFVSDDLSHLPVPKIKQAKAVTGGEWCRGWDYIGEILHLIGSKLQPNNIELVLISSDWISMEEILDDETDCYYFIAPPVYALPKLQQIADSGYRFAVIGSSWAEQQEFLCVDNDNYITARRATEFLLSLGHTKIAYACSPFKGNKNSADRLNGLRDALQEGGITLRQEWCTDLGLNITEPNDLELTNAAVRLILESADRPTAFVVDSYSTAASVYQTAHALGIRIPEHLSVLGFDDHGMAFMQPPVTTFCQPLAQMVDTAMDYLLQVFKGNEVQNANILLPCTLMERASTVPFGR